MSEAVREVFIRSSNREDSLQVACTCGFWEIRKGGKTGREVKRLVCLMRVFLAARSVRSPGVREQGFFHSSVIRSLIRELLVSLGLGKVRE